MTPTQIKLSYFAVVGILYFIAFFKFEWHKVDESRLRESVVRLPPTEHSKDAPHSPQDEV